MTLHDWHEEAVSKAHDRKSFDCGDIVMNDFLRRYAGQSHEQNASKAFCAIDATVPTESSAIIPSHHRRLRTVMCQRR